MKKNDKMCCEKNGKEKKNWRINCHPPDQGYQIFKENLRKKWLGTKRKLKEKMNRKNSIKLIGKRIWVKGTENPLITILFEFWFRRNNTTVPVEAIINQSALNFRLGLIHSSL